MMRADYATHAKRYPHCPEHAKPDTWRAVRAYGLHNWARAFATLSLRRDSGRPVWYTHTGPEFRQERFADECEGGPDHRGWFTQADGTTYKDGTGLARGIVARLSHGRFVAGYWWGDIRERVYFPDVYDDERDAARAADSHAESFADSAREDSEKFDRMQDAETAVQDAIEALRDARALRRADRRTTGDVCDAIEALRDARAELAESSRAYEDA
jgi:hypothetical protein